MPTTIDELLHRTSRLRWWRWRWRRQARTWWLCTRSTYMNVRILRSCFCPPLDRLARLVNPWSSGTREKHARRRPVLSRIVGRHTRRTIGAEVRTRNLISHRTAISVWPAATRIMNGRHGCWLRVDLADDVCLAFVRSRVKLKSLPRHSLHPRSRNAPHTDTALTLSVNRRRSGRKHATAAYYRHLSHADIVFRPGV